MTGIGRRDLLRALAAGALCGIGAADAAPGPRKLVLVVADGGWDLTFTFDPKPGAVGVDGPYPDLDPDDPRDREEIGTWGALDVTLNEARRPAVTAFFERWGHRCAAVRGVWVGSVSHPLGRRRILCGTDDPDAPDLATRVGALRADDHPLGSVDLSNVGRFGALGVQAARSGVRGQLGQLLRPATRYPLASGAPRPPGPSAAGRAAIDGWLAAEADRQAARRRWDGGRQAALASRQEARDRAAGLLARAGELAVPPPGLQRAEALATFATSLLATGTCATVLLDSGSEWDTHLGQAAQHAKHDLLIRGLDVLLSSLAQTGLLSSTLVVVTSEMTRTPWRNAGGGTDHWPYTGVLMAGAGVRGGHVCGGTDASVVGRRVDPGTGGLRASGELLRYDHVAAGILAHLGVDPAPILPGVVPLQGFAV